MLFRSAYYPGQEIFEFRSNLHLSRDKFGEVLGYAGRSISNWEKGSPIADHALRSFKEVRKLFQRACAIVPESEVVRWMKSPNKELGEISPLEAIRLGKLDEVLRLIILAEEGIPV